MRTLRFAFLGLLVLNCRGYSQVKMPFDFTPGNTTPAAADLKVKSRGYETFRDSAEIAAISTGQVLYYTPRGFTFDGVGMKFLTVHLFDHKVSRVEFEGGYSQDAKEAVENLKSVRNFLSALYSTNPDIDDIQDAGHGSDLMGRTLVVFRGKQSLASVESKYSSSDGFYIHVYFDDLIVLKLMELERERDIKALRDAAKKKM
jgi:hypothetical protein